MVAWNELLRELERYRVQYEGGGAAAVPQDDALANSRALQRFVDEENAATGIRLLSRSSGDVRTFGRTVVLNMLLRLRRPSCPERSLGVLTPKDMTAHQLVWHTRCNGVFTTNYDTLLEDSFHLAPLNTRAEENGHSGPLRIYKYSAEFLKFILSVPRFVLKLHGDVNDLGTMVFDPASAWNDGGRLGPPHGTALLTVFQHASEVGHMVYVGAGLRDETFKRLHGPRMTSKPEPERFESVALVPEWEVERIARELGNSSVMLEKINLLTYADDGLRGGRASVQHQETQAFLNQLRTQRRDCAFGTFNEEALDLYQQMRKLSTMRRKYLTHEWSAMACPFPSEWSDVKPNEPGTYWCRPKQGDKTPFIVTFEYCTPLSGTVLMGFGLEGRPAGEVYEWSPVD